MKLINVSTAGAVARIELDNPSKLNAISTGMWRAVVDALATIDIAMISGYCLGAGVALATACDLRIASAGSRFGIPAARLGLACPYPIAERLAHLVGPSTAKRILFTADRFSAEDALRWRLIDEVVAASDLMATVQQIAVRIAANAPLTIVAAKHAVETVFSQASEHDMATFAELERACTESRDYTEGRRAFIDKREPIFQGR